MKRIPLFDTKPGPTPPGPSWHDQVVAAVACGDNSRVVELVSQRGGRLRLREGFAFRGPEDAYECSFATLCLRLGAVGTLRAVVDAAPDGVTLHDTCVQHVIHGAAERRLEVYSDMVLHQEAVGGPAPHVDALALAFDCEADHPCITGYLDCFDGATLHHAALLKTSTSKTAQSAQVLADCCRLLIDKSAPFGHKDPWSASAYDMLFRYRWHAAGLQDAMVPLIGDYVRAGLVGLNSQGPSGHRPLEIAISAGNGFAAAAVIDLGCDLALPAFPQAGDDPLAFAAQSPDTSGSCFALVAEAVMRRHLGAVPAATPAVHPVPRRAQRAGI